MTPPSFAKHPRRVAVPTSPDVERWPPVDGRQGPRRSATATANRHRHHLRGAGYAPRGVLRLHGGGAGGDSKGRGGVPLPGCHRPYRRRLRRPTGQRPPACATRPSPLLLHLAATAVATAVAVCSAGRRPPRGSPPTRAVLPPPLFTFQNRPPARRLGGCRTPTPRPSMVAGQASTGTSGPCQRTPKASPRDRRWLSTCTASVCGCGLDATRPVRSVEPILGCSAGCFCLDRRAGSPSDDDQVGDFPPPSIPPPPCPQL